MLSIVHTSALAVLRQDALASKAIRFVAPRAARLVYRKSSQLGLAFASLFGGVHCPGASQSGRVHLPAAGFDRAGQVVQITLPGEWVGPARLRDGGQKIIPLQRGPGQTATLVVPFQRAGESLSFRLEAATGAGPDQVRTAITKSDLHLSVGDRRILSFRLDRNALPRADIKPEIIRAGYIHPVYAPSGRIVTDDYPAKHAHHHGIWTPWTKTSFQGRSPDFWNMHNKTGAEDLVALDRTWQGPVHGGFEARLKMVDLSGPAPVRALHTTWTVTAYAIEGSPRPVHLFDLALIQTCATKDPVILPTYNYGGFGIRAAAHWNGPGDAVRFLTASGGTDRLKDTDSRVNWCYVGGAYPDGPFAGTAVLGHPGNFRAPQPVRLHHDMPYFSFAPQQLGEFRIAPGEPYVAGFRFVVADGEPDQALLEAFWQGYAHPAAARVEAN